MALWNPWHGCHKISAGCQNCYMYRTDAKHGRDSSIVSKTATFTLPLHRNRAGEYKIASGEILFTCFTSDFFVEEADEWRDEAWRMMRIRSDLHFFVITKRIHRFYDCIPMDWSGGYENVTIACTVENQDRADYRLPLYLNAPIKHKRIVCEPLLGPVDLSNYLCSDIENVTTGGESGTEARHCHYDWVLSLRGQCVNENVSFTFKQTGARFVKDGRLYQVPRKHQHAQAKKAGLNTLQDLRRFD